jgi:predicted TIM-barrel fold metal-dependent hydrolase
MGELLPYMLDRIYHNSRTWGKFERDLRTVWRENIWVTTSGMFTLPPLECLLKMSSLDHVMFSTDYPFSSTETGLQFVEEIEKSGLLTEEQLEGFCHGNAEKLLKLRLSLYNRG